MTTTTPKPQDSKDNHALGDNHATGAPKPGDDRALGDNHATGTPKPGEDRALGDNHATGTPAV
ncbi:hypothetical protein [Streptomyces spiramenti]|uniref:Sigma-like protein n=1 Tax=Streptomyces spiramenti TaxID=2720606 RepID=A0ABX1ASJ9_9ACTN|nr:hypothetical protein [Streptomyces spiramenti]NJP68040.1 hypothetical protein [Streptomyces spiramenti]